MKLSWGHGIVGAFVFFIGWVVYLVTGCFQVKVDLVTDNYYEEELKYQNTIDAAKNMNGLQQQPVLELTADGLLIVMPEYFRGEGVQGEYTFYRPNDKNKDFQLPMGPDENMKQLIPYEMLEDGRWEVKMKVKKAGKDFYKEEIVVI